MTILNQLLSTISQYNIVLFKKYFYLVSILLIKQKKTNYAKRTKTSDY